MKSRHKCSNGRPAVFEKSNWCNIGFTGDAAGQWSNWKKNGRACYICGYHPMFFSCKIDQKIAAAPISGGVRLLFFLDTFGAALRREEQIDDLKPDRFYSQGTS